MIKYTKCKYHLAALFTVAVLAFAGMTLGVLNKHFVLQLSLKGDLLALSAAMM